MMKYILTFLSLCLMANFVTAQSNKIVYLNKDTTQIPVYYFDAIDKEKISPLYIVEGKKISKEQISNIPIDSLEDMHVLSKNDTVVDGTTYLPTIELKYKKGTITDYSMFATLSTLIYDSLHLKDRNIVCTIDDRIVFPKFENYRIDLNKIMSIRIHHYLNAVDKILIVSILTKSKQDLLRIKTFKVEHTNSVKVPVPY